MHVQYKSNYFDMKFNLINFLSNTLVNNYYNLGSLQSHGIDKDSHKGKLKTLILNKIFVVRKMFM